MKRSEQTNSALCSPSYTPHKAYIIVFSGQMLGGSVGQSSQNRTIIQFLTHCQTSSVIQTSQTVIYTQSLANTITLHTQITKLHHTAMLSYTPSSFLVILSRAFCVHIPVNSECVRNMMQHAVYTKQPDRGKNQCLRLIETEASRFSFSDTFCEGEQFISEACISPMRIK